MPFLPGVVHEASRPKGALLEKIGETGHYLNSRRHSDRAQERPASVLAAVRQHQDRLVGLRHLVQAMRTAERRVPLPSKGGDLLSVVSGSQ